MFESGLIKRLFAADNELDRFDILTEAAFSAEKFPDEWKTDENRLSSCETRTWFRLVRDGGVKLLAESDSLFVKGLCKALGEAAKDLRPGEDIGFAEACFARGIIDAGRRDGLLSLERKIIEFIDQPEDKNEKSN